MERGRKKSADITVKEMKKRNWEWERKHKGKMTRGGKKGKRRKRRKINNKMDFHFSLWERDEGKGKEGRGSVNVN